MADPVRWRRPGDPGPPGHDPRDRAVVVVALPSRTANLADAAQALTAAEDTLRWRDEDVATQTRAAETVGR